MNPRTRSPAAPRPRRVARAGLLALALLLSAVACRQTAPSPRVGAITHGAALATAPRQTPAALAIIPSSAPVPADELARWIESAPAEAAVWLASQPASPALDTALGRLATHPDVIVPRPAFAAEQAQRIGDAGLRLAALSEVVSTWARFDPDAARLHVSRLGQLDDLERTRLHELVTDSATLP